MARRAGVSVAEYKEYAKGTRIFTIEENLKAFQPGNNMTSLMYADGEMSKFIEEVGFCQAMTDARREMPSIYIAVCARRDVQTPRNVQKDAECSAAWVLKDETFHRGRVYYGKITKAGSIFVAPDLIAAFNSLFGVSKNQEKSLT